MVRRGVGLSRSQAAALSYPATQLRSGQVVGMPHTANAVVATAVVADTMYAWPIPIPAAGSIRGVALQVGTAVAGVSGKLGAALPGPDGLPLTLLAECPTPVDMNSTASTQLLADFTAAIPRQAGLIWGLCVFNGAAQPVTIGAFGAASIQLSHFIGATNISGYTSAGSPGPAVRLTRAQTYAAAFPATLTGWTVTAGANPSSPEMVAVAVP